MVIAAAASGWTAAQSTTVLGAAAGACAFAAALAIPLSLNQAQVIPCARVVAWLGVIAPLTFNEQRTATDLLHQSVTGTTVAQAGIAVGCLLIVVALARPPLIPFRRNEPWLAIYAAVAIISASWSVAATPTFLKALQTAVAYLLVLSLIRMTEPKQLIRSAFCIFQLVVLSTIIGLLVSPNQAFQPTTLNVPRLQGAIIQVGPDLLGVVAAVACLWALARVGPRWTTTRWITVVVASLDITLLLLSRSRTGVGTLGIGLVVLALQGRRQVLGLILSPVAALLVAGILAGNVGGTVTYLQRNQSSENLTTLTGRTNNWSDAFSMWKRHPAQGFGYYAGHRLASLASETARAPQNLDNMWIETLQNLGLMGIIPMAGFVIVSGFAVLRPRPPSHHLAAVRAAYAALLFASFLNPSLQKPSYVMALFLIVLLVDPAKLAANEPNASAIVDDSGLASRQSAESL